MDEPPQRVLPLPTEQPGEVFDADAQCSFVYGKEVKKCNFMVMIDNNPEMTDFLNVELHW